MKHVLRKNDRDRRVIEAILRRFGPISRVDIHELTHIQRSEISRLTRELLAEGKLVEAGRANNRMGRKQVLLGLNEKHAFVVGVGVDDENVRAAVMDLHPKMKSFVSERTILKGGAQALLSQVLACARKAIEQAEVRSASLVGVGVACSGLVNSREGTLVLSSTLDFWKQVPLQQIFEREFGVPTLVENITRAKTAAERTLGAGAMAEDMIYVEYGRTGIGAGIFTGGKLVYGSGFAAGEFGHTHILVGGPACKCGSFGCLEATAGAAALEGKFRKAVAEGGSSHALELVDGDESKITGWTVMKAAQLGDKTCTALVEQVGNYLGLGLANLVNLFNPSILVLDRRLSAIGNTLLDQITKIIKRQALSVSTRDLVIQFGELGDEASVLGAGSFVLEKHFEIPALKPPRFMIESVLPPRSRALHLERIADC